MSNNSNAPFVSTKKYPLVTGQSNSPFTDQRAVEAGGGSGGLGNVIYDGVKLNVDDGTGSTVITSINNTNAPLSIQNDGGGLQFNAAQDTTTLRGDNLLSLTSSLGDVSIETVAGDVNIDSAVDVDITSRTGDVDIKTLLGGDIKIASDNDIDIATENGDVTLQLGTQTNATTGVYNNDSFKDTAGDLFAWRNRALNSGGIIGGFKMSRDSGGRELLICDNIDTFSFAGNNNNLTQLPAIKFSQISGDDCHVTFINRPQNDGDVLTFNGVGDGRASVPRQLEWQPPASGSGEVTFADDATVSDGKSFKADGTTINEFFLGPSGSNVSSNQRSSISRLNGDLILKSESTGTFDIARVVLEADRATDGNTDKTAITVTSFQGAAADNGRDQIEILVGQTIITPIADILNPNFGPVQYPYFSVVESFLAGAGTQKREDTFQISNTRDCKRFQNFAYQLYAFGQNSGTISNNSQPVFGYNYRGGVAANAYDQILYRYTNVPSNGDVLTCAGGDGSLATPFDLEFSSGGGGGGGNLNSLDIEYNTSSSTLVLSDPVDGVISTTPIVSGRTILIESLVVNGQGTFSVFGLSNTVFPPLASTSIIGNNPPSVPLGSLGESLWSVGNTFRVTIGGKINDFDNNDNLVYQVISNRGQTSQNVLNSFNLELSGVANTAFGFTWVVLFTVRTLNVGAVLGTIATNSNFTYTDDQFKPETEGAIVTNVNASFDTSIQQYLDLTLRFPSAGNSLSVTTAVIERIF